MFVALKFDHRPSDRRLLSDTGKTAPRVRPPRRSRSTNAELRQRLLEARPLFNAEQRDLWITTRWWMAVVLLVVFDDQEQWCAGVALRSRGGPLCLHVPGTMLREHDPIPTIREGLRHARLETTALGLAPVLWTPDRARDELAGRCSMATKKKRGRSRPSTGRGRRSFGRGGKVGRARSRGTSGSPRPPCAAGSNRLASMPAVAAAPAR